MPPATSELPFRLLCHGLPEAALSVLSSSNISLQLQCSQSSAAVVNGFVYGDMLTACFRDCFYAVLLLRPMSLPKPGSSQMSVASSSSSSHCNYTTTGITGSFLPSSGYTWGRAPEVREPKSLLCSCSPLNPCLNSWRTQIQESTERGGISLVLTDQLTTLKKYITLKRK